MFMLKRQNIFYLYRSPTPGPSYTTPFQLSVNLNLELEHGRPNKVRVPQEGRILGQCLYFLIISSL